MAEDESYTGQVERHVADLRLKVNALEVAAKNGSLPGELTQTRRTVHVSAALVALALLVSSLIRTRDDPRVSALLQDVQRLERRLEALERGTKGL